jgi:hypothetical protein
MVLAEIATEIGIYAEVVLEQPDAKPQVILARPTRSLAATRATPTDRPLRSLQRKTEHNAGGGI